MQIPYLDKAACFVQIVLNLTTFSNFNNLQNMLDKMNTHIHRQPRNNICITFILITRYSIATNKQKQLKDSFIVFFLMHSIYMLILHHVHAANIHILEKTTFCFSNKRTTCERGKVDIQSYHSTGCLHLLYTSISENILHFF